MRASEQSAVRHTHSLRCESATWVAAQPAVPEAVTRARHSKQCWVSCLELPGPSGLMRASERSRRRQLLLGKATRLSWEWISIATTCRAGSPWWSCSHRARVNAAGAAESRYDSSAQVTGARTSGIVRMLGPKLLVDVPAALWNAGPRDRGVRTSGVV